MEFFQLLVEQFRDSWILFPSIQVIDEKGVTSFQNDQSKKVKEQTGVRLFLAWLLHSFMLIVSMIACNIADLKRPQTEPLPDFLYSFIPYSEEIHPDHLILPYVVITVIAVSFHAQRMIILRRMLILHALLLLMRDITMMATSLPDPNPKCNLVGHRHREVFELFNPLYGHTCGDLVFSGHTTLICLLAMVWHDYFSSTVVRVFVWIYTVGIMLTLTAARMHYTLDIILGLFLTVRLWRTYHQLVIVPSLQIYDPFIRFMEDEDVDVRAGRHFQYIYQLSLKRLSQLNLGRWSLSPQS
eukprot:GCRY01004637.1.p1 GENE.GCRY01004637.1~~GCRY01004637.1.p1  ORF type:complete len:298 (-),score=29.86 GCRY01004637.1:406-1299(-)